MTDTVAPYEVGQACPRRGCDAVVANLPSHLYHAHHDDGLLGARDLVRLTSASYRQLDYWTRMGWLTPVDGEPAPGSGYDRRFSPDILPLIHVLRRVMALRALGDRPALLAEHIREHGAAGIYELVPGVTLDLEILAVPAPKPPPRASDMNTRYWPTPAAFEALGRSTPAHPRYQDTR